MESISKPLGGASYASPHLESSSENQGLAQLAPPTGGGFERGSSLSEKTGMPRTASTDPLPQNGKPGQSLLIVVIMLFLKNHQAMAFLGLKDFSPGNALFDMLPPLNPAISCLVSGTGTT